MFTVNVDNDVDGVVTETNAWNTIASSRYPPHKTDHLSDWRVDAHAAHLIVELGQ